MAFFMESTFIAVMFFGWNKVSKRFHLVSTWLVAIGANLSALWILVANAWMQYPAGMHFNPDTVRNEMVNFWDVLFSPVAINKFLHTITSSFLLASVFVIGVSAWYLLKGRHVLLAKRSIIISSVFGLLSSLFVGLTGDGSAYQVAQKQPMKLAAMEGLYKGHEGVGLVVVGMPTPGKAYNDSKDPYIFKIQIPKMLSILSFRDKDAFVPGITDIIEGGYTYMKSDGVEAIAPSVVQKIEKGKLAIQALTDYNLSSDAGNKEMMAYYKKILDENFEYFGYGYLKDASSTIPRVPEVFYSFRIMVGLGLLFIVFFALVLYQVLEQKIETKKWLLRASIFMVPMAYIASQAGWIVAELGRQPWVIQDILPTTAAVSRVGVGAVQVTFFLFLIIFTTLLIAELKIMFKQIKLGPKEEDQNNDR